MKRSQETEAAIAGFERRAVLRQQQLDNALNSMHESTVQRTPEETAELQARRERLQREQEGDTLPVQLPVVDLDA